MIRYLTADEVIELHRISIERFGGSYGLRDSALLDSAIAQPQGAFGGQAFYPTIPAKAAALAFSLVNNHPFIDGNKRAGFAAMAVFLELNGLTLNCSPDDGEKITIKVASGAATLAQLTQWVEVHSAP